MPKIPKYRSQKQFTTQGGQQPLNVRAPSAEIPVAREVQKAAGTLQEINNVMYEEKKKTNLVDAENKLMNLQSDLQSWSNTTDEQLGSITEDGVELSQTAQEQVESLAQIPEQYDAGQDEIQQMVERAKVEATAELRNSVRKRETAKMAVKARDNIDSYIQNGNAEKALEVLENSRNVLSAKEYQETKLEIPARAQFNLVESELRQNPDVDLGNLKKEYKEISDDDWGVLRDTQREIKNEIDKQQSEFIDEVKNNALEKQIQKGTDTALKYLDQQDIPEHDKTILRRTLKEKKLDRPLNEKEVDYVGKMFDKIRGTDRISFTEYKTEIQPELNKLPPENEWTTELEKRAKSKLPSEQEAKEELADPFIEEIKNMKDEALKYQMLGEKERGFWETVKWGAGFAVPGVSVTRSVSSILGGQELPKVKKELTPGHIDRLKTELIRFAENNPNATLDEVKEYKNKLLAPVKRAMLKKDMSERFDFVAENRRRRERGEQPFDIGENNGE